MKNKLYILFLFLVCLACSREDTSLQTSGSASIETRSTPNGRRIVPLKIYLENEQVHTRALPGDIGVVGSLSNGEGSGSGEFVSYARDLQFLVYLRDEGSNADFTYDQIASAKLNRNDGGLGYMTLQEETVNGKTFALQTVYFEKNKGKEYKILVLANGQAEETNSLNFTQKTYTQALYYNTADGQLNHLTTSLSPKSRDKVPKLKTSNNDNDTDYDQNVSVYSAHENFYGYCEKTTVEPSDNSSNVNVITYDGYAPLQAYLYRTLARVEFRLKNLWYSTYDNDTYLYRFPWVGIYAKTIGTNSPGVNYDNFKTATQNNDGTWKLLTFYDDTAPDANPFGGYFFKKDTPGTFTFVTYMFPTVTEFKIRIKYKRDAIGVLDYVYCSDYKIPIRHLDRTVGSSATGVVEQVFSNDQLTIQRNKKYLININYRALVNDKNGLEIK